MSRIGKNPITVPQGVTVTINGSDVNVTGPKGSLKITMHVAMAAVLENNQVSVKPLTTDEKIGRISALWGLTRALIQNLIIGVTQGFEKKLELHGVGYRAELKGQDLVLNVGYSHPVEIKAPEGIVFAVEKGIITVSGIDKYLVGETSASIRRVRKPEPYKGKGIRYVGEYVRRKEGKVVGATDSKK
jgi:large subunit ribosomal protein L6